MFHLTHTLALLMAGSTGPGAAATLAESATRATLAAGIAAAAVADPSPTPSGITVVHEDGATTLTLSNGRDHALEPAAVPLHR